MASYSDVFVMFFVLVMFWKAPAEAKCPLVMGKVPFDVDKFAGSWYLVAGSSDTRRLKGCGQFNVTVMPHRRGLDAVLDYSFKGTDGYEHEGIAQSILGERNAMMYSVQRRVGEPEYGGVFRQAVIASDYKSFAVVLSCRAEFDVGSGTFGRTLLAEVLSRTQEISQERIRTLASVLTSFGIEEHDLQPTCSGGRETPDCITYQGIKTTENVSTSVATSNDTALSFQE